MELFDGLTGERLRKAALFAVYVLGLFLLVESISVIQGWRYVGAGVPATNTITVSGHGEVNATPDIATFTFTVSSTKPTVAEAQNDATAKVNATTAYLKSAGIADKDIQTSNYSVYPQYEYQGVACPIGSYCPGGKQVLVGYQASQTTTVKVRDLTKAGDLIAGVGSKGATEVSQLTFTFDDPTQVQEEARGKAITDAKDKANALAADLGVTLVRVVSFNESNGAEPRPVMYAMGKGGSDTASVAPAINPGQNKTTDDVTITYEIK